MMLVQISEIVVHPRRRNVAPESVRELADSISALGLLNPITVDHNHILIAGLHRLEAAKLLNWTEIECSVSSLEGLMAEMAELDENFVRANLSQVEFDDLLLRRKELYEMIHPETKNGGDRKSEKIRIAKCESDPVKPFIQDTADKLGVHPSTVARQIQTAKNLTPEAKEIIRNSDAKITKTDALKLSRLEPERQKEAASQLAEGKIRSIGEFQNTIAADMEKPKPTLPPAVQHSKGEATSSTEKIVADLKSRDKNFDSTADSLLSDIDGFVERFHRDFAWYSGPVYAPVFSEISQSQLAYIRQRFASVTSAMKDLLHQIERNLNHEQPKKAPRL